MNRFLRSGKPFVVFGREHQVALSITVALSILLPLAAVSLWKPDQNLRLNRWLTLLISGTVIIWTIIRLRQGLFQPQTDLPLDLCNLMAFILPLIMWTPSLPVYEILYFLILAGTLQAILTPDIPESFPHYTAFKYWLVHSGLVIYIIYVTAAFGLRPSWASLWRAFIVTQIYLAFAFLVNYLLNSNYVYTMHKPPQASLLDYFGPWPWYILVTEFVALMMFALVYLPLWLWG